MIFERLVICKREQLIVWSCRVRQTHVLQAAHEVVADRRPGQVGRVRASSDVEEVVGAQHGVILLRVSGGGQNAVHRDGDLRRETSGGTERRERADRDTGLKSDCGCAARSGSGARNASSERSWTTNSPSESRFNTANTRYCFSETNTKRAIYYLIFRVYGLIFSYVSLEHKSSHQ